MGSSISGPMTSTRDMTGWEGNVTTAMASDTGELRADVVKISGMMF